MRFTEDAQEIFDQWRDELEIRLRTAELPPALESHLAKYRSLMPFLALIFQLIEFVDSIGEGVLSESGQRFRLQVGVNTLRPTPQGCTRRPRIQRWKEGEHC